MYLSYAKDVVVACIERGDKMGVEEAISTVIAQGNRLYEARPGGSPTDAEPSAQESLDALGIKGKAIDNFEEEDPWAGMDLAEIPSL
jgi:LPS sulfotransferase NodH